MPTQDVARSFELAALAFLARLDHSTCGRAVRTQAAVLRALLDEIERRLGLDHDPIQLRNQVREEVQRLALLMFEEKILEPAA